MTVAVVGVIPAAGHATRLQPLDVSKEVYPVGGRPVMDHLMDRMWAAPADELRVVTRPEKPDVIANARSNGARVIEARPATLARSLLEGMRGLADDDVVLLGFPDSIWEPLDGYRQLLALLRESAQVALGLFRAADLTRYEPVLIDDSGSVRGIEFKPARPSSPWIWGCAAASVATLRGLEDHEEPGSLFNALSAEGGVAGVRLSERYIDIGTHSGLREALDSLPG